MTGGPGPVDIFPGRRAELAARRARQRAAARRRRRRLAVFLLALAVLLTALVGGAFALFRTFFTAPDHDGPGEGSVVVRVVDGATTTEIGRVLVTDGVVASVEAFTRAAAGDERIRAVQPGYYRMRARMSGESAVALMLDPAARVGQLEIRGGVQLDDTRAPDGTVTPGVLSLVAAAACLPDAPCVTAEDLRRAMAETDPAPLGVPAWAVDRVAAVDPVRRLEGLFAPGRYDVRPGAGAVELLRELLAVSAARLEGTGLLSAAQASGADPYDVLVIASLVEKEGVTPDMPRVARVIYNRLEAGQRLELDSTVNYPLDIQALRTTAEDRARVGPYNSYAVAGLPPTPIAAAGRDAIAAALQPEPGPWLFFVRCRTDGLSCFAVTLAEHEANVARAIADGAF